MTESERDQIVAVIDLELGKSPALINAVRDRESFLRDARKAVQLYYADLNFSGFVSTQSVVYAEKLGAIEAAADAMGTDSFS